MKKREEGRLWEEGELEERMEVPKGGWSRRPSHGLRSFSPKPAALPHTLRACPGIGRHILEACLGMGHNTLGGVPSFLKNYSNCEKYLFKTSTINHSKCQKKFRKFNFLQYCSTK